MPECGKHSFSFKWVLHHYYQSFSVRLYHCAYNPVHGKKWMTPCVELFESNKAGRRFFVLKWHISQKKIKWRRKYYTELKARSLWHYDSVNRSSRADLCMRTYKGEIYKTHQFVLFFCFPLISWNLCNRTYGRTRHFISSTHLKRFDCVAQLIMFRTQNRMEQTNLNWWQF